MRNNLSTFFYSALQVSAQPQTPAAQNWLKSRRLMAREICLSILADLNDLGSVHEKFGVCLNRVLRPIHTRDFAPGAKLLRVYQRFHGTFHLWEQNFHPAKCSTIFNRLNIWEQAPGANSERTRKRSLVCTDTYKMSLEYAPGAKPLCVSAFKGSFFSTRSCLSRSAMHIRQNCAPAAAPNTTPIGYLLCLLCKLFFADHCYSN